MKYILMLVTAFLLAGCDDGGKVKVPLEDHTHPLVPQVMPPPRFRVEKVETFDDYEAYYGYRSVYVITDTQTGQEFVGVAGIGISELGSHHAGKSSVTDER